MLEEESNKEYYVVVKLNSGEQLMAILNNEDDEYIELQHPIMVKTTTVVHNETELQEHTIASPFCKLSKESFFVINKANVTFINQLKDKFVSYYIKLLENYDMKQDPNISHMTNAELETHINNIENILNKDKSFKEVVQSNNLESFLIEGNNTIN